MSRMANIPVRLPAGVEAKLTPSEVSLKSGKGDLRLALPVEVSVEREDSGLRVAPRSNSRRADAMVGTVHALLRNMVTGVTEGFAKKLELRGVGYRARAQGAKLNLTLGYSHAIDYTVPTGITVETPTQTEIVVSGADKQQVGQVAAEIRKFRPPEPYKGKGVRYVGERVFSKEAKKK